MIFGQTNVPVELAFTAARFLPRSSMSSRSTSSFTPPAAPKRGYPPSGPAAACSACAMPLPSRAAYLPDSLQPSG